MPSFLGKPFLSQAKTNKANLLLATMFIGAAATLAPTQSPSTHTNEHPYHHEHNGHEHTHSAAFVLKTDDSQNPASYKIDSDKLPSIEKVHTLAQQMLEEMKPAVSVPMNIQINTKETKSVMTLVANQNECTLLINPSQMSWDTWSELGLNYTSDQNVQDGVIKTVIAHEIGHCAQAHPGHLEPPNALKKLLALGNITQPTHFMQYLQRPTIEQEEYADLFAMSYAIKNMPKVQADAGIKSLYAMRMANSRLDKTHDTAKQLEQRFERLDELTQIDVPLNQLAKVVEQIHKNPNESLLPKVPTNSPSAQQALTNLPTVSGVAERLEQQNAKNPLTQQQQAQGPNIAKSPRM